MTERTGLNGAGESLRIDKWLWRARFFKSRSLATTVVAAGRMRVNRQPIAKPHYQVRPGDVLTFPHGPYIRVIEVLSIGTRRGPPPEARTLYNDLDPPDRRKRDEGPVHSAPAGRDRGAGRPTKKDRRAIDHLRR